METVSLKTQPHKLTKKNHGKSIELNDVTVRYGSNTILDGLSLRIEAGEFFTLLGPSGCGKTTTLRLVAGLIQANSGNIFFDSNEVTDVPVHKRNISMVFQNYGLMPHLSVLDNVAYGLKMKGINKSDRHKKAKQALEKVGLVGFEDRYPVALSGGQQQRVGLARAVAVESGIMLLDEPLSNLDTSLRQQMCIELRELQQDLQITILYVTHDRSEALSMSSRVGVMWEGKILDLNDPETLYTSPNHLMSARLLGDINELKLVAATERELESVVGNQRFVIRAESDDLVKGQQYTAGVRPENIHIKPVGQKEDPEKVILETKMLDVEYQGSMYNLTVFSPEFRSNIKIRLPEFQKPTDGFPSKGELVDLVWDKKDTHIFASTN
ncbi:MAG: ABC transporter ATP-binding protein [Microbacteriaceae bacterium]